MNNVKELLNKKYGPLPVWAWAAITAVLIFGLYYIRKKRAASSTTANQTPSDAGNVSANPQDYYPYDNGSGGGGSGLETPQTPPEVAIGTGPVPSSDSAVPPTSQPSSPVTTTPNETTTASPTAPSPKASTNTAPIVNVKSSVPASVQLQSSPALGKAGPSGVYVPTTKAKKAALNHPSAVKITANKTGGSANKTQGVFAIH